MTKNKKHQQLFISLLLLLLVGLFAVSHTNSIRSAFAQAIYQTPTPGADGRIIYTVQQDDTCTRVFLLTGVSIEDIIRLNGLDQECSIYQGQPLVIGVVEPASEQATAEATINPMEITPSPTPSPGTAELCVVLFNDIDGTGMRSDNELYLAGGQVSLSNSTGTVSKTGATVGGDPELLLNEDLLCFVEIPEGEYNITMGIPQGYNPTTITNYKLKLKAGNQAVLDFGAQVATNVEVPEESAGGGRNPILGIAGGFFLLGGLGLAIYMWRARKP